jgi:hypothetical protein
MTRAGPTWGCEEVGLVGSHGGSNDGSTLFSRQVQLQDTNGYAPAPKGPGPRPWIARPLSGSLAARNARG